MNEAFLQALEESLSIKHEKVSLVDEWSRSAPDPYRNLTLKDFLGKVGLAPVSAIIQSG